jgi:hypothetical protein
MASKLSIMSLSPTSSLVLLVPLLPLLLLLLLLCWALLLLVIRALICCGEKYPLHREFTRLKVAIEVRGRVRINVVVVQ